MIKFIFVSVFLLILASLAAALFNLVRQNPEQPSNKTAKALTVRVSLSIVLFLLMVFSLATGILKPHGIGTRIHPQNTVQNVENKK